MADTNTIPCIPVKSLVDDQLSERIDNLALDPVSDIKVSLKHEFLDYNILHEVKN